MSKQATAIFHVHHPTPSLHELFLIGYGLKTLAVGFEIQFLVLLIPVGKENFYIHTVINYMFWDW